MSSRSSQVSYPICVDKGRILSDGLPSPDGGDENVVYSTMSIEFIRQLAIEHYRLSTSSTCIFYHRGVNDVYQLISPEGKFALRVSPAYYRTRDALLAELSVITHICDKGVEVARPVPRADGGIISDFWAPDGLRRAVVFEWASGLSPQYSSEGDLRQFGILLAKIHAAADDLAPQRALPSLDMDYLLWRPLELIQSVLADLPDLSAALELAGRGLAPQLCSILSTPADWGFCHGDVATHNAKVVGDRVVLFDFDFCSWGDRLFDLACYKYGALFDRAGSEAWTPFIEGYLELRPSIEERLRHIELFVILRNLWLWGLRAGYVNKGGYDILTEEFFDGLVMICKKVESLVL